MLPVEIHLEEFVKIPVEADVHHLGFIGPEVGIGQAAGEDLSTQLELAEAGRDLEGPQSEVARSEVEWAERVDQGPVAERLAGQDVPCLDRIAARRDADGRRPGPADSIILEPAIPGAEQG